MLSSSWLSLDTLRERARCSHQNPSHRFQPNLEVPASQSATSRHSTTLRTVDPAPLQPYNLWLPTRSLAFLLPPTYSQVQPSDLLRTDTNATLTPSWHAISKQQVIARRCALYLHCVELIVATRPFEKSNHLLEVSSKASALLLASTHYTKHTHTRSNHGELCCAVCTPTKIRLPGCL